MKKLQCGWPLVGAVLVAASSMASAQEAGDTAAPAPAQESAASRLSTSGGQVDRAQLEVRFRSVGTLLEQSSGAKQIESSGDPRALEKRAEAQQVYRAAQEAFAAEDLSKASQLLSQASMIMFQAVRLAAPEQVTAAKKKMDYSARLDTVKAMLDAHKRIAKEKSAGKAAEETNRSIEQSLAEANELAAAGKYAEGRLVLDRAYLIAKASIASLRGGDTLVRSLNFATKEEEYHYEIDRNDTHQMLIQVLLSEKRDSADINNMVNRYLEKAKVLRAQAEAAAGRKDFAAGIKLLEESTAEVVRAIRNAGIYIPG